MMYATLQTEVYIPKKSRTSFIQQFQFQSTNAINIHRQHNKYGLKMTQKV